MTPQDVKGALISVLKQIQAMSGLDCPELGGTTVPPKELPKFDSTIWPVAASMIAKKLDVTIPNDVHIFGGGSGAPLLSIDETVALICKKAQPKTMKKIAA
jgi:hypothetical protein